MSYINPLLTAMFFSAGIEAVCLIVAVLVVADTRVVQATPDTSQVAMAAPGPRVVIVGAGIGGASCAYHLKKQVPGAQVTVLEARDRSGGRIKNTDFFGKRVTEGATVYCSFHEHIAELVRELNLPTVRHPGSHSNPSAFVWDGEKLVSQSKLLGRDPSALADLDTKVKDFLAALALNYRAQDSGTFDSVSDFLKAGGLDFYASQSAQDLFRHSAVSETLQKYFLEPETRIYFGQGLTASSLLTMISLAGTFEDAFSTKGGMSRLVEATIKAANCDLHLTSPVTAVTKTEGGTYQVTYGQGEGHVTIPADVVVIAAPLEYTDIKFEGFKTDPSAQQPTRQWQRLYYVVGHVAARSVRASYFKEAAGEDFCPAVVSTTSNTSQPWVVIREIGASRGYTIYSVFSSQDLSQTGLQTELFEDVQEYASREWEYLYPLDGPNRPGDEAYQSIVLDEGLYNLNAMESVATQMEIAVSAGRNVAKLIAKEV